MDNNNNEIQDSSFILLVYESINYILSKKIEKKEKNEQIEQLGINLGEKVTHFLMNDPKNDSEKFIGSDNILNLIFNEVWYFIFKNKNNFLNKEQTGIYKFTCSNFKLYNYLIVDRSFKLDEKLNAILKFSCGILKGALNAFNIDSLINYNIKDDNEELIKLNLIFEFIINIVNYEFKNIK